MDKLKISKIFKEYLSSKLIFIFFYSIFVQEESVYYRKAYFELQEVPLNIIPFLGYVLVSESRAWFY